MKKKKLLTLLLEGDGEMMKKLLVLMLVLGLASVSQAALVELVVDAGTVPAVGESGLIVVDLIADFDCIGFEMGLVTSTDILGTVPGSPGGSTDMTSPILTDAGYVINSDGLLFDCATGASATAVAAGSPIASFSYIIPSGWSSEFTIGFAAEGTPYIDGFGDPYDAGPSYASDISAVGTLIGGVTIIPEPATIALLGLGGLFLRRRRK